MKVFRLKQNFVCALRLIAGAKTFLSVALFASCVLAMQASVLMEEGFSYSAGSNLAGNAPWIGSAGTNLSILAGNLNLPLLRDAAPNGNMLRCGGGSRTSYRTFTSTPVTNGVVYGSFLLNVVSTPTNSQFLCALLSAGVTTPNQPDDPLDLYIAGTGTGYTFRVGHTGDDLARANAVLSSNATHLIVFKYTFPSPGRASIYLDPTPGQAEPASPNAITENEGNAATTLQNILFNSPGSNALYYVDTLRIGTNWADVTPLANPLSTTGPADALICTGQVAQFIVNVTGTAPFTFQWRTNGYSIAGATTSSYAITNPGPSDVALNYDVVVHDTFGMITSRVATLAINSGPPIIMNGPRNQFIPQGTANATFTIQATGQPLAYQWRMNVIAVDGATNSVFNLSNPQLSDASNSYDVIVANGCGALTSSTASLIFLHEFYPAAGLAGFFGGMNLFTTNGPGALLYVWSSPDLTIPLTDWTFEGQLNEQPLNDGTGSSRYTISVNPPAGVMSYVIGETVAPPYLQPIPVETITTDLYGNCTLNVTTQPIVSPPQLFIASATGALQLTAASDPGIAYSIQVTTNIIPPILWTTVTNDITDSRGLIQFPCPTNAIGPSAFYRVSIP